MAELIIPCFSEHQAEADVKIIGRLLAGYGELELEMCECLAAAVTNNLDGAIKILFRGRSYLPSQRRGLAEEISAISPGNGAVAASAAFFRFHDNGPKTRLG